MKGGLCIAHGGTQVRKKCKHPDGCEKVAKKGGLCKKHAGTKVQAECDDDEEEDEDEAMMS